MKATQKSYSNTSNPRSKATDLDSRELLTGVDLTTMFYKHLDFQG